MSGLIYIGEDSAVEARLMRGLLEPNWRVEHFEDGLELYQRIHQRPPDLLVTDLMLPGLDGFLLTRLLKFDSQFEKLPIICVSSILEPDLPDRLEQLGADQFLAKPLDPDCLTKLVESLLARPVQIHA